MNTRRTIHARLQQFFKSSMTRRRVAAVGVLSAALPLAAYAAEELNVFEAGSTISSSAVNDNFSNLDGRIASYEDAMRWMNTVMSPLDRRIRRPSRSSEMQPFQNASFPEYSRPVTICRSQTPSQR